MNVKMTGILVSVMASAVAAGAMAKPMTTPQFLRAASATDKFEQDAGKIAQTKGGAEAVKSFGAMMVADHDKTTADLKMAVQKAGLPGLRPPTLMPDQAKMMYGLEKAHPGKAFDKLYIKDQIMAHEKALKVMQTYASDGDNAVLKDAAGKTAPIVEHHLGMAKMIKADLK